MPKHIIKSNWQKLGVICFWVVWPGLWLYLRGTTRTRVLVVVDKDVLLVKTWLGDGRWSLPGGGLHRHELVDDGALSELYEETGLQLERHSLRYVATQQSTNHGLAFTAAFFVAELREKPHIRTQRFEIADYAWIPVADSRKDSCSTDVLEAIRLYTSLDSK